MLLPCSSVLNFISPDVAHLHITPSTFRHNPITCFTSCFWFAAASFVCYSLYCLKKYYINMWEFRFLQLKICFWFTRELKMEIVSTAELAVQMNPPKPSSVIPGPLKAALAAALLVRTRARHWPTALGPKIQLVWLNPACENTLREATGLGWNKSIFSCVFLQMVVWWSRLSLHI